MKDVHGTVKKLLLTEKGTLLTEKDNQYTFKVARDANKLEIKKAVEEMFNVKVTGVRTMMRPSKLKRVRRMEYGATSPWKRAVVTLAKGDSIDLN